MFLRYSSCRILVEVGHWTLTKDMNAQMGEYDFPANDAS